MARPGKLVCPAGELIRPTGGVNLPGGGVSRVILSVAPGFPVCMFLRRAHNTRHDGHTFALHPECDRLIGRLRDVVNVERLFGHRLGAAAERREFFEQARGKRSVPRLRKRQFSAWFLALKVPPDPENFIRTGGHEVTEVCASRTIHVRSGVTQRHSMHVSTLASD
jgi:hypothetical protein